MSIQMVSHGEGSIEGEMRVGICPAVTTFKAVQLCMLGGFDLARRRYGSSCRVAASK